MKVRDVLFVAWETERAVGSDGSVADWIRTHLVPRLSPEDQMRVQAADEWLVGHLDREFQETRFGTYLSYLFEERAGRRSFSQARQLAILEGWLSTHLTVRGLKIAVECLRHIGTRRNLELLDRYTIDGDPTEVQRIKADARFAVFKRILV